MLLENIALPEYDTISHEWLINNIPNCGLRRAELENLKIKDISLNEDKFSILGKGNKERTGYLNKSTAEQVYGKLDDSVNDSPLVKNVRKNTNIIDIIPSQKNFG